MYLCGGGQGVALDGVSDDPVVLVYLGYLELSEGKEDPPGGGMGVGG